MNARMTERQEIARASEGTVEIPTITLLGSLDDSQGTIGLGLNAVSTKPVFAIIYNGL
ncbi:hypothetical protein [Ralstonia sp. A12]|uniref:hypothetical protein n=1 Tax=Ralstonia sp. A12 TaxID=1217052 RepID=UPI000AC3488D|nr:hypothetical protein [Ralstonia sp. A12]